MVMGLFPEDVEHIPKNMNSKGFEAVCEFFGGHVFSVTERVLLSLLEAFLPDSEVP